MKKTDIYDAISGIDERFCTDSENFEDIASEFKRAKTHKIGKIISFAACLAFSVIAGINIYDMNLFNENELINPAYRDESGFVTEKNDIITESKLTTSAHGSDTYNFSNENVLKTTASAQKLSTDKSPDFYSTETGTTVDAGFIVTSTDKPITHIPDTAKPPVSISETPAVTAAAEPEITETSPTTGTLTNKPETTCSTEAPVTTKPTGNTSQAPDNTTHINTGTTQSTEATDATAGTDVTTKSTASTIKNTGVTATDNPGQNDPNPNETNISEQYYICGFENTYYQAANDTIDSALVGEYLGEADMNGYAPDTGTYYHCKAKAYKINDIPVSNMIAVLFEDKKEFFTYISYDSDRK